MSARNAARALLCAVLVFLWAGGIIAHVFLGGPPAHVAWTAPLFLVVAGAIVILSAKERQRLRLGLVGAIGMLAEIVGVRTGFPFGRYEYTAALFPWVFEVPLVMSCAWVILAAFAQQIIAPLGRSRIMVVPVFATLLTAFDLLIDPVAAGPLAYWAWQYPGRYYGIPATNFGGWWIVSACIALVMNTETDRNPWCHFAGYVVTSFFTVLAAANGMVVATLVGIALLILPATLHRAFRDTIPRRADGAGGDAADPHDLAGAVAESIDSACREGERVPPEARFSRNRKIEGAGK